jgi:hypothetical protein
LSTEAKAFGKGWGFEAKAGFSFGKSDSLKENEVLLKAKHVIDLGKSIVSPANMAFTKDARQLLATN